VGLEWFDTCSVPAEEVTPKTKRGLAGDPSSAKPIALQEGFDWATLADRRNSYGGGKGCRAFFLRWHESHWQAADLAPQG